MTLFFRFLDNQIVMSRDNGYLLIQANQNPKPTEIFAQSKQDLAASKKHIKNPPG